MSGRRKLSGLAALAVLGNGWTEIHGPWEGLDPKDGPDIVLDPSVDDMEIGSMWADITRAAALVQSEADQRQGDGVWVLGERGEGFA